MNTKSYRMVRRSVVALCGVLVGLAYPIIMATNVQAATQQWHLVGPHAHLSGTNLTTDAQQNSDQIYAFTIINGVLYAGTQGDGVFKYDATSSSWQQVGSEPLGKQDFSRDVTSLTNSNGILYAGTWAGVYAYENGAWTSLGMSSEAVNTVAEVNGTLYAGTDGDGVFMYNSTSKSWSQVGDLQSNPNGGNRINKLRYLNGSLYAATDDGVYVDDNGSWNVVGTVSFSGLPNDEFGFTVYDLAVLNGTLYAGTDNGVFGYALGSKSSTWQSLGTACPQIRPSFTPEVSVGSTPGNGAPNLCSDAVTALAVFNGSLYAGTSDNSWTSTSGQGVLYYSSSDEAWHSVLPAPDLSGASSDMSNNVNVLLDPPPLTLYAGTQHGVYSFLIPPTAIPVPSHQSVTQTGWLETWTSVPGATSYNLYLDNKLYKSGITATQLNITGQQPDSKHQVTVTALNGTAEGQHSKVDNIQTLPLAPSATLTLAHNSVTETGWVETWNSVAGASSYNIYIDSKLYKSGVTGTQLTVTGESPSTLYHVTAQAINSGGKGTLSAADEVTTLSPPPTTTPSAPKKSTTTTVPNATSPVTGFPALPWTMGGLFAVLSGGALVWRERRGGRRGRTSPPTSAK